MTTPELPKSPTVRQRIEAIKPLLPTLQDAFNERAQERQRQVEAGEIDDSLTEEVWFDNVVLEVNPDPSIYWTITFVH
jgi:hypothetical protein